jgi:WD40 repeat protein
MRNACCYFLLCLLSASFIVAQQKKAVAPAAATAAAKICAEPYAVTETADGWPEGPVTILFHRDKSKAPWSHNPAIRVPGLEATTPASARTVVCVEESLLEMGRYDSGEAGYSPSWDITLVRMSDRKVYFARSGFFGDNPPGMKFQRGAGIGKPPVEPFVRWLRLIADQKVARLKMRLAAKDYAETSALAFSPDGTKLAMAQEARSTSSGTPPSPITVFDLTNGKAIATLVPYMWAHHLAFSKAGNMIAADGFRHAEVWDISAGKVIHKLEAPEIESLGFAPDGSLAVAGGDQATLWDVAGERKLRTTAGAYLELSSSGKWLVAKRGPRDVSVQEFESGQAVTKFPVIGRETKFAISDDGRAMARYSVLGGSMYVAGNPDSRSFALPSVGVGVVYAVTPMHGGFVVGNGDGIVGLVSASSPEPSAFATDYLAIKAVAISADGKLIAVGDSSGHVSIWELR